MNTNMSNQTLPQISIELKRIDYEGEIFFVLMEVEEGYPERFSHFALSGHPGKFPQGAAVQWLIHEWNLSTSLAMSIVQNQMVRAWEDSPKSPASTPSDQLDFVRDTLPDPDAVDEALARDVEVEETIQKHLREMPDAGEPPPPPKTPHSRDRVRPRLLREDLPAPTFSPPPDWCSDCNTFRDRDGNCICP